MSWWGYLIFLFAVWPIALLGAFGDIFMGWKDEFKKKNFLIRVAILYGLYLLLLILDKGFGIRIT